MADRGSLNMRNITLAIQEVVQWYPLGVALGIARHKLDEIKFNHPVAAKQCKFALIDVWLRTDVSASWGKLAAALDEAGDKRVAGGIKEKYLGISATTTIFPPSSFTGASNVTMLDDVRQPPTRGHISTDGPVAMTLACRVPVPISAQAPVPPPPVTNVREAMDLLKTDQEKLISGLTHSTLDVNFSEGNAQGMTMLHYAAMQGADTDCLKALIAFGANINPLNQFEMTPLDQANLNPYGEKMVSVLERVRAKTAASLTRGQQPVRQLNHYHNPQACNILSITSSGPYCIIQLETLQQLEVHMNIKITALFQWIVACGFGALFLLFVIYGNKKESDLKRLYFKLREEVFCESDMARRSQALDGFLQAHLGTQMKMSDIKQPGILIGALYKGSSKVESHLFNNCLGDNLSDMPVWKVARYTCSLPLNIMECDNYVSMDTALPNVSSLGLRRIRKFYRDSGQDPAMVRTLVCIEAGQCNAHELDCVDVPVEVLSDSTASQWFNSRGALDRLTQLLTLYNSSAVVSSEESLECCRELCEYYDIDFHHFNPLLPRQATLSLNVALKDIVDSVIQTISQFVGKPLDDLTTRLNNV